MELPPIREQETRQAEPGNTKHREAQGPPDHLVTAKEKDHLARVCWLLNDAGTLALRTTFDSIHPPLTLPDHLGFMYVKNVLQKLHQRNVIPDKQWRQLYPPRKKRKPVVVTSQNFDSKVLVVLLQTVCHLTPPYPHGWHNNPLPTDNSLSADVTRLELKLLEIGALSGLRKEEYPIMWQQSVDVLQRLGNTEVKVKIQRMENEPLPSEMATKYINLVKDAWSPADSQEMIAKLVELENQRRRGSGSRSAYLRKERVDEEGIPPEDRAVIRECYKLLVDKVQADDVMDKLQKGQVVKVTDRQEIMAAMKSTDRMKILLTKIMKTTIPYAFKLLCDAIKFKYPSVYEQVMKTRKQIYKQGVLDTTDFVGLTREGLESHYKEVFGMMPILPWSEVNASIKSVYCQLDVVDADGNKIAMPELLPAPATTGSGRGPRVVLEGCAGSGKTSLATMLAYMWAIQPHFFVHQYKFLLYLDAHAIKKEFSEEVYNQLLPPNFKVSQGEFWSLMENNASDVLIVADGFEGGQGGSELTHIIQGSFLRSCAMLILVRPEGKVDDFVKPDYKIYSFGLKPSTIGACFQTYVRLFEEKSEEEEDIADAINPAVSPLAHYLTLPYICTVVLAIYRICGLEALVGITTLTKLFEKYLVAMAMLYCKENNIEVVDNEFPEEVTRTVGHLETFAFHALTTKSLAYTTEELADVAANQFMTKLGVLQKAGPGQRWKFVCSLLRDFLGARFLADLPPETVIEKIHEFNFLRSPRAAYVIAFACGLDLETDSSETIGSLVKEMAAQNLRRSKKITFKQSTKEASPGESNGMNSGSVQCYAQSLMSIAECKGREDLIEALGASFPKLLQLSCDGVLNETLVKGLNYSVASPSVCITNLEIKLGPLTLKQREMYISFAEQLQKCEHLKILTVAWSSLAIMAEFLKTTLANHPSLSSLRVDDYTKKPVNHVSASTWADIHDFSSSLTNVQLFSFVNCKTSAVTCHVIQTLPPTLKALDLTKSSLNMIGADELGKIMEKSKTTKTLKLTDTHLTNTDLAALFQCLKRSESLQHLDLAGVKLDRIGLLHVSEYLKINGWLRVLDLSRHNFTSTEMCLLLVDGLKAARGLKKVVLNNVAITEEGRDILESCDCGGIFLEGLESS